MIPLYYTKYLPIYLPTNEINQSEVLITEFQVRNGVLKSFKFYFFEQKTSQDYYFTHHVVRHGREIFSHKLELFY